MGDVLYEFLEILMMDLVIFDMEDLNSKRILAIEDKD